MVRTQVLLDPALKQQVQQYADRQQVSFSQAARVLMVEGLKHSAVYPAHNPAKKLLKLADGAGSGPKDLASNDEYLYKIK